MSFDADTFLNSEFDSGFETKLTQVPEGEYDAIIEDVKPRKFTNAEGQERAVLEVSWLILDEDVKQQTELEKPLSRQTIWLDVNDNGTLERGKNKNLGLGNLLEALGLNDGKPWSPSSLKGLTGKVKVEKEKKPQDPENPYTNVTRVAAA